MSMQFSVIEHLKRENGQICFRPISPIFVKISEPLNPLYSLVTEGNYVLTNKHLHGYLELYHDLLEQIKSTRNQVCVVELGMGAIGNEKSTMKDFHQGMRRIHGLEYPFGGSLRLWERFFGSSTLLVGWDLDVDAERIIWGNHHFVTVDTRDPTMLRLATAQTMSIVKRYNHKGIDLFIDDGLHEPFSQIAVMKAVYPCISPGGFYVIEDVCVDGMASEATSNRFVSFASDSARVLEAVAEISGMTPSVYQFRGAGDQISSIILVNKSSESRDS
jgi:hypothetical protein